MLEWAILSLLVPSSIELLINKKPKAKVPVATRGSSLLYRRYVRMYCSLEVGRLEAMMFLGRARGFERTHLAEQNTSSCMLMSLSDVSRA